MLAKTETSSTIRRWSNLLPAHASLISVTRGKYRSKQVLVQPLSIPCITNNLRRSIVNKQKTASVLLSGLFLSGLAVAADNREGHDMHGENMHGGKMPPMFSQFDKNNDGRISREEMKAGMDSLFTEVDTNKDGFLSNDEMQAHRKAMHEKHAEMMSERWKAADKDGDSALSKAELESSNMSGMARNFDKLDKNKDGKLTQDEIAAGMPHRAPRDSKR
jgi:Ca2+-binding EF-hand superfamily protein